MITSKLSHKGLLFKKVQQSSDLKVLRGLVAIVDSMDHDFLELPGDILVVGDVAVGLGEELTHDVFLHLPSLASFASLPTPLNLKL